MQTVVLSRTSRLNAGHLWVFSNELKDSPRAFTPGSIVELRDKHGEYLGKGYINPHSLIAVRVLTRGAEEIDKDFFRVRIERALDYRRRFVKGGCYRAVYSEGDGLPGLIIDRYAECVSAQITTLGMEQWTDVIIELIEEIFDPSAIVLRNDSSARSLEGLPLEKRVVKGSLDTLPVIDENGLSIEVDPMHGQKTGMFLDQRENRALFGSLALEGEDALDLFCYTGSWALALASGGVKVTGVDASDGAVSQATRNAELNGLSDRCRFTKADVFDFTRAEFSRGARYGLIVLDPPAFVKSKQRLKEGLKAYRELNTLCMKLLKQGGLLATSSCSYHVGRDAFMEMLRASARDAGRSVRVIETRSQAKDHPVALSVPETEYLKCVIAQVQ